MLTLKEAADLSDTSAYTVRRNSAVLSIQVR